MTRPDTHYASGEPIRAGDRVRGDGGTGVVVFVLGAGDFAPGYDPADWAYLGRGFMTDSDRYGLLFAGSADEVELLGRKSPGPTAG